MPARYSPLSMLSLVSQPIGSDMLRRARYRPARLQARMQLAIQGRLVDTRQVCHANGQIVILVGTALRVNIE